MSDETGSIDIPARAMLPLECQHCEVEALLVTGRLWNYLAAAQVTDTSIDVILAMIPTSL